ncbi:bis(5'-nucleosyl)-tetraphosphatase [Synechococcus sp. PCC 7336]|uniref:bis(5'-nucleosyl)-tetraphosphatase n=1 Tax=Synechococcus sp. PCC 7336 TaxID=195250 RepID=UPI00034913C1|nr:NUDIX domain-containing protein [Synechococcus sp. PCC 7336]
MLAIQDTAYGLVPICATPDGLRYLLILHNKGHWGFPKGHKDEGESDLETACREFREEVGIDVYEILSEKVSFSETYRFVSKSGNEVHKTVKYFLARIPIGPEGALPNVTIQPEELADSRWCLFEEAEALISFDAARGVLQDCQRYLQDNPLELKTA